MKYLNLLTILILLFLYPSYSVGIEKKAPDFTVKDINGNTIRLSEERGKVVLLTFWATWCRVCIAEMDTLERIYRRFKDKGFVIIAVSIDRYEESVKEFMKEKKITFPVAVDPEKNIYFDKYGGFGVPMSFLIDKKGYIRDTIFGENKWDSEEFINKLNLLLNER